VTAREVLLRDAGEIAAAVREGHVSATAIAHASLERISDTEPRVNAFTDVTVQRALATAAALDARLAVGDSTARGLPLLGVPFAVKRQPARGAATVRWSNGCRRPARCSSAR